MSFHQASDARTPQPDSSGLQSVMLHDDGPEVVPTQQTSLLRNTSTRSPEVWTPPPAANHFSGHTAKQETAYSADNYVLEQSPPDTRAHYTSPPEYYGNEKGNSYYPSQPEATTTDRRICGIKRKTFFIILGVVLLIIVIVAAVVGGVVGSRKSSSSSPDNSTPAQNNTQAQINAENQSGLASLLGKNGAVYTYYQAANGSIIEHVNSNNNLSSGAGSSVVVDGAFGGSPLAVTSYTRDGATRRQLVFLGSDRRINTIHTTGPSDGWTGQTQITSDPAIANSPALAACAGSDAGNGLNGIRIYYASSSINAIREVGQNAIESDGTWHPWQVFNGSDPTSGVGCAVSNNINHLYLRNASTGAVTQWLWDYTTNGNGAWNPGAVGATNITKGGDIAVVYDGSSNDNIFYQSDNNQVTRAIYVNNAQSLSGYQAFGGGNGGSNGGQSKLSAVWVAAKNAAAVLYQDSSTVLARFVGKDGNVATASTVS